MQCQFGQNPPNRKKILTMPQNKQNSDVLKLKPQFSVGNCIGSDHLPLHCTLSWGEHHSVSPLILALIKEKRKLRRMKSDANSRGDAAAVHLLQQSMNKVGNEIKKEQKKEQKTRHEAACKKLEEEKNPYKFFRIVKHLTAPNQKGATCTKVVADELGNIARTAQERINLFANRLERVHQTPEYEGFDETWKA